MIRTIAICLLACTCCLAQESKTQPEPKRPAVRPETGTAYEAAVLTYATDLERIAAAMVADMPVIQPISQQEEQTKAGRAKEAHNQRVRDLQQLRSRLDTLREKRTGGLMLAIAQAANGVLEAIYTVDSSVR